MKAKNENAGKWSFFQVLAAGLKQEPAYLLIFALAALFFIFGLGSGVAAAVQNKPELWFLAFAGLLCSLIAAVIVISKLRPSQPVATTSPSPQHSRPSGDQTFDEVLYAIHGSVNKALEVKNDTFREGILQECAEFRARASDWSDGVIRTHGQYNQLLIKFYERAQRSVFSTSIPDYLTAWTTSFGDQLMQAHQRSRAIVTRVFVFNRRNEVSQEALVLMEKQEAAGVKVRLYFSDESRAYPIPVDISKDFTVIDHGEAIGITMSFGGDNLAAMWYIQDNDRKQRFEGICESLTQGSEDLSRFREWWRKAAASAQA